MKGHKDAIYDFVVDIENRTVYSAGAEGFVVKWNIDNPENGELVLQGGEAFYSIWKNGDSLQLGSRSGKIYTVDLANTKLSHTEQVHTGGVFFIRDGLSGSEDGVLMVGIRKTKVAYKSLRCIVENKNRMFVGSSDANIYAIDRDIRGEVQILEGHINSVFALEMLDENTLVSTGRDAHIRAWDLTMGKEVHAVPAHDYQAKSLSWNGSLLLSSSMDKTIKIWNAELELLKVIDFARYDGHTNCINKVQWIDENMFVSCSDDRTLCLWKVEIMP